MLKLFIILASCYLFQGFLAKDDTFVVLTEDNFESVKNNGNLIVLFMSDRSHYEKLDEMYAQLAEVSLKEGNRDLIYGLVDCKDSPSVCEDNLVARNVELKVIALRSKVETVINFLTTLIDDVLNEDAIIDRWEEPGKCFVLFKVVSCKYCKIALKNWNEVKKHFADRNSEICLGMVDCNRHRDLCHRYEIRRYPRFYWFDNNANGHFVSNFTGDREASQLIEFAEEKLKDSS